MITRLYRVECNGCGARTGHLYASMVMARKTVKKAGWLIVPMRRATEGGSPGKEYCPTCREK